MPWFRVDDGFHSHPKRLSVSLAAVGLWTVAGSWSSAHLTDGVVPDNVLPLLSPDAPKLAGELVAAGLWKRRKGGYQFHDWGSRNPSRQAVENERKANAERQRRHRERQLSLPEQEDHFARALPSKLGDGSITKPEAREVSPVREAERNAVTNADSNAVTNGAPTQPYPRSKDKPPTPSSRASPPRATRLPDDFAVTPEMVSWAREHAPHVDGRRETEVFIDYWRSAAGAKARKADWTATWRNWMRREEDDLAARPQQARPTRQQETDGQFARAMQRIRAREESGHDPAGNSHPRPLHQIALPAAGDG